MKAQLKAERRQEVRLRVPSAADVDLLDLWASSPDFEGEFSDFGLPPVSFRESIERGNVIDSSGGLLLVEQGRSPVGSVSWHVVSHGPNPLSRAFDIGIALIPSARGVGIGSTAQRLLAEYLFRTTQVHRVQASTDARNVAEQRALERAGFVREGVLRGAQYRRGAYHDLVSFATLRDER